MRRLLNSSALRVITILLSFFIMASAADTDLAGRYAGEWKSGGAGGNGTFRIALDRAADGAWKCEITFTLAGSDVKTTVKEVKVQPSKLEVIYDFDLGGANLRSRITGEWKDNRLEGRYTTTSEGGDSVDEGDWTATRAK